MANNNELKIILSASLDTSTKTIKEINDKIKYIQTQVDTLKLNVQVSDTVLKTLNNFSQQMSRLSNEALQASKNVQEVLLPNGTKIKTTSFDNLHNSMDELIISSQKAAKTAEGIVGATKETTNETQKLNDVTKEREKALQYEQRVRKAIADKLAREREKALQYEQKTRQGIEQTQQKEKQKTAELQKQLEIYRQQAQLNIKNIKRTHGTTVDNASLDRYLKQVNSLTVSTPDLNHKMKDLNMQFKQISTNARSAAGALQQSGMSVGEMLQTAMVNGILPSDMVTC